MERSDKLEILDMLIMAILGRNWAWEEDLIESTAMSKLERVLSDAYQKLKDEEV